MSHDPFDFNRNFLNQFSDFFSEMVFLQRPLLCVPEQPKFHPPILPLKYSEIGRGLNQGEGHNNAHNPIGQAWGLSVSHQWYNLLCEEMSIHTKHPVHSAQCVHIITLSKFTCL